MTPDRIICPRCGESLPSTLSVCDACGLELSPPPRAASAPVRESRPKGKRPVTKQEAIPGIAWLLLVVGLAVGGMVGYALHSAVAPRTEGGAPQGPADIMAGGTQESPTGGAPTSMPAPVMQMVQSYKAAIAKNPKDKDALIGLANLEFDSQQWAHAIEYYSRALDIDGTNADVRVDRAIAYHATGQNDLAKKELLRVTHERPEHKNAWLNLGVVSRELGDRAGAVQAWERYLKLDPNGEHAADIRQEMESLKQAG
ncbi:MAG TPA: tetratricopeptide repeat protein [Candidatus Polarisedimenticolia bacterium]|nr:tetratricopeptide repeat protein [Candidatus Polarisedimenticolia bacterium]